MTVRYLATALFGLLAVTGSVAARANADESPTVASMSDRTALAAQLAEVMSPSKMFRQSTLESFDRALAPMLASPEFLKLEKQKPGIVQAVATSVRTVLVQVMDDNVPDYRRRLIGVLEPALTIDEMRAALAFYSSAVGQKMLQGAVRAATANTTGAVNTSKSGETTIDKAWMNGAMNQAMVGGMQALSAEDMPIVMEFAKSGAGPKIAALNDRIKAEATDWANGLMAKAKPKVEAAAKSAIVKRLSAK